MTDVLPTHSHHLWSDRKQIEKMQPCPPLQTVLAVAVLRDSGIDVNPLGTSKSAAATWRRFYQFADQLLRNETAEHRDPELLRAAREGLHATFAETEA